MGCGSSSSSSRHHITKMHVHDEDIPPPVVKSSPPPPSILRELFNDIAANVTDAVDHQGRATAKGLVALVEEISIISGTPSEKLPKPSQVDEVMTHLDVNKNGTIEFGGESSSNGVCWWSG